MATYKNIVDKIRKNADVVDALLENISIDQIADQSLRYEIDQLIQSNKKIVADARAKADEAEAYGKKSFIKGKTTEEIDDAKIKFLSIIRESKNLLSQVGKNAQDIKSQIKPYYKDIVDGIRKRAGAVDALLENISIDQIADQSLHYEIDQLIQSNKKLVADARDKANEAYDYAENFLKGKTSEEIDNAENKFLFFIRESRNLLDQVESNAQDIKKQIKPYGGEDLKTSHASKVDTVSEKSSGLLKKAEAINDQISSEKSNWHKDNNSENLSQEEIDALIAENEKIESYETPSDQIAMLPEPEIVFNGTSKKPLDHIEDLTNDINKIDQAFMQLLTKKVENNFGSYEDVRAGFNNQIVESLGQIKTVEYKIEEAKKLREAYLAGQSDLTRPEYEQQFTNYMKQANKQLGDIDASGAALTESVNQADKMAEKGIHPYSLRAKFLNKYFNDDFVNTLRSIDFGKYIFRSLNPEADMPQAAELKNEIINLLTKDSFTDEKLVGLVIDKTKNDPGSVTFDMVADMVDSHAYENFGKNNAKDRRKKNSFEEWIREKSVLSKLDNEVLVTLHEESLRKVIDAIALKKEKKEDLLEKIDKQVESFKEFSDSVEELKKQDPDFQKKLEAIINGQPQSNVAGYGYTKNVQNRLDGLYSCLYGEDAIAKKELLYAPNASKKPGAKEACLVGLVANENLVLEALTNKEIIEKGPDGKLLQIAEQPVNKGKKFNPVTDVARTFGMSVAGAAVVTTLSSIPVVGKYVAGIMAVSTVGRAAWSTFKKEKAKLGKNVELKSSEIKKIAGKAALAMVGKSLPYIASSFFGTKMRAVSAGWMLVKTWYDDVNRTAAKQRNQSQNQNVEKGFKGLKNKAKAFGQNLKSMSLKEHLGAAGHALAKAGAMFAGGQLGAWGGAKVGEMFGDDSTIDVGDKLRNLGDKFKGIFNRQSESPAESPVVSDNTQFIYEDNRTYEDVQKNYYKKYQKALKNLGNGTLTDADVDAIQNALRNIDKTGDLIRPNAGASADTSGIESATNENSSTSGSTTEPSASQTQSQSQTQTQVETETKLSALNMKDVSLGNSESGKNNDVAVVPPHIDDVSIGNGKIVDLDDIDVTYVPSSSLGNKIDEGTINTHYLPKDKAYDRGV